MRLVKLSYLLPILVLGCGTPEKSSRQSYPAKSSAVAEAQKRAFELDLMDNLDGYSCTFSAGDYYARSVVQRQGNCYKTTTTIKSGDSINVESPIAIIPFGSGSMIYANEADGKDDDFLMRMSAILYDSEGAPTDTCEYAIISGKDARGRLVLKKQGAMHNR